MTKYSQVAEQVFGRPWAILPEYYETMRGIVLARMNGGNRVDFEAALAGVEGRPSPVDDGTPAWMPEGGRLLDGVAVLPVAGVMARRMNLFMHYSGGVSTEMLGDSIAGALDDDAVEGIVLDIDSPGGAVNGSFGLAEQVYAARGKKPIVALANGLAASAAYLLASAADAVLVNEAGDVGSVGVILTHLDYSAANEQDGVKPTYIYRGHYKAMGNQDEPLDDESREYLQGIVDEAYTLFVDKVARNRGLTPKAVAGTEARTFMGLSAVELGLADEVGELADAIAMVKIEGERVKAGERFVRRPL